MLKPNLIGAVVVLSVLVIAVFTYGQDFENQDTKVLFTEFKARVLAIDSEVADIRKDRVESSLIQTMGRALLLAQNASDNKEARTIKKFVTNLRKTDMTNKDIGMAAAAANPRGIAAEIIGMKCIINNVVWEFLADGIKVDDKINGKWFVIDEKTILTIFKGVHYDVFTIKGDEFKVSYIGTSKGSFSTRGKMTKK